MSKLFNLFYYIFLVPYFIIGGGYVALSAPEPSYISVPAGLISFCLGLFLIWLDQRYDLD